LDREIYFHLEPFRAPGNRVQRGYPGIFRVASLTGKGPARRAAAAALGPGSDFGFGFFRNVAPEMNASVSSVVFGFEVRFWICGK
jgi:hypothetical protein